MNQISDYTIGIIKPNVIQNNRAEEALIAVIQKLKENGLTLSAMFNYCEKLYAR